MYVPLTLWLVVANAEVPKDGDVASIVPSNSPPHASSEGVDTTNSESYRIA